MIPFFIFFFCFFRSFGAWSTIVFHMKRRRNKKNEIKIKARISNNGTFRPADVVTYSNNKTEWKRRKNRMCVCELTDTWIYLSTRNFQFRQSAPVQVLFGFLFCFNFWKCTLSLFTRLYSESNFNQKTNLSFAQIYSFETDNKGKKNKNRIVNFLQYAMRASILFF